MDLVEINAPLTFGLEDFPFDAQGQSLRVPGTQGFWDNVGAFFARIDPDRIYQIGGSHTVIARVSNTVHSGGTLKLSRLTGTEIGDRMEAIAATS